MLATGTHDTRRRSNATHRGQATQGRIQPPRPRPPLNVDIITAPFPARENDLRVSVSRPHVASTAVLRAMAKRLKRRSKPRPPTFVWKRSDINILLACLDYSLQHNLNFENTAITHIAKRTGKEMTAELIQRALKKETKFYGREGPWTVQDLLSEGSIFLGYSDTDRENIREEISRIEPPRLRYWLRSTSVQSPSRSRTLSLDRRQRRETSTLSNHSTPEFAGLDEFVEQFSNAGPKNKTDEEQVCTPYQTRKYPV